MLDRTNSPREIRRRLLNPPNGRVSEEIEIIPGEQYQRERIRIIDEAERARRDVERRAEIEAQVARAKAFQDDPEITLPTVDDAPLTDKHVSVNAILSCVADFYQIPMVDMLSPRRTATMVRARHIAMYLARNLTSKSFPQIGRLMGRRDHTTILHGVKVIESRLTVEPGLVLEIAELRATLA